MASEKDVQDIINTLIAEGVGEGEEGMRRIAETILTRGKQRGLTPAEVVRERAQYTGYSAPGPAAVRAQQDPSAISAAQAAWQLAQGPDDPTGGANHYWNPNIVNPSWAGSMQSLGQFGNHAFATDRPVQSVARALAPQPQAITPTGAAVRQMTSPSGGNTALQTALDKYVTRERNRVTPADAFERTTARNKPQTSAVNQAARRAVLSMGGNQTMAGQDRGPSRSQFSGDPGTPAQGTVLASIPTTPQPSLTQPGAINASVNALQQNPALAAALAKIRPAAVPSGGLVGQSAAPPSGWGQPPATRVVPTTTIRPSASDMARGRSGISTVASIPTTQPAPQFSASDMARGRSGGAIPDRLTASPLGMPALYGGMSPQQVASIGVPATGPVPTRFGFGAPQPRTRVASAAPMPFARPSVATALSVRPPVQAAPRPVAAALAQQPLRIVVNGGNVQQPQPSTWAPQGYTNDGSGRITSNETGGVYYERHLR